MFKTRLLSGIVLVLVALLTIGQGGYVLFFTLLAVSVIGMNEFYRATGVHENRYTPLELLSYLGAAVYYCSLLWRGGSYRSEAMMLVLVLIMTVYVFGYPKYESSQIMAAMFGFVYVAVMLSYIWKTRMLPNGVFDVWLIFLCSWGCDTCAYCVGVLIGKHKMAPVLSPKKSIEGAVGGVAGAMLLGAAYAAATGGSVWAYVIICGVGALISMVGDLAASAVKRQTGIKDYGTLIPGHGGILDRFDSVIFTAPIIFFLASTLAELF